MVNHNTMIKIIENAKEEGRKQGAKEELEKVLVFIKARDKEIVWNKDYSAMQKMIKQVETTKIRNEIEKRLSELEEKGVQ